MPIILIPIILEQILFIETSEILEEKSQIKSAPIFKLGAEFGTVLQELMAHVTCH